MFLSYNNYAVCYPLMCIYTTILCSIGYINCERLHIPHNNFDSINNRLRTFANSSSFSSVSSAVSLAVATNRAVSGSVL